jgi:hypothetical protein
MRGFLPKNCRCTRKSLLKLIETGDITPYKSLDIQLPMIIRDVSDFLRVHINTHTHSIGFFFLFKKRLT